MGKKRTLVKGRTVVKRSASRSTGNKRTAPGRPRQPKPQPVESDDVAAQLVPFAEDLPDGFLIHKPTAASVASEPSLDLNIPALRSVAIVGRSNVGKSTLFNRWVGRQASITDPTAGTTRDRVLHEIRHNGLRFDIVDTGGIGVIDEERLAEHIEDQIQRAILSASLIVFIADAQAGLTPFDETIARDLRRTGLPIVFAINKTEGDRARRLAETEFGRLGFPDPFFISALHGLDVQELLDRVVEVLLERSPRTEADDAYDAQCTALDETTDTAIPKIALVGRRNVGKSSILNQLSGMTRAIVSDIAGTTRDSIDIKLSYEGRPYILTDTAGVHRLKRLKSNIDFYAQVRSERAIMRSDIVALLLDSSQKPAKLDLRVAELAARQHKPLIIVFNKWDLIAREADAKEYAKYIGDTIVPAKDAPIVFTNALQARNLDKLMRTAFDLYDRAGVRISTGTLNRAMDALLEGKEPPHSEGKKPRLYYLTQVGVRPPTIIVSCSYPSRIDASYRRYLARRLKELLGMDGVPLRIFLKDHHSANTERAEGRRSAERRSAERRSAVRRLVEEDDDDDQ